MTLSSWRVARVASAPRRHRGRRRRAVQASLWAAATLMTGGCDLLGIGTTSFIVPVDSIVAPQSISAGDALPVFFFGRVGPDGCSRVSRVDTELTAGSLEITFHGERDEYDACTDMPVLLEHRHLVPPPLTDPFVIRAIQPDGPALERTVRIH